MFQDTLDFLGPESGIAPHSVDLSTLVDGQLIAAVNQVDTSVARQAAKEFVPPK